MNRNKVILFILLIVLLLALGYSYLASPRLERVTAVKVPDSKVVSRAQRSTGVDDRRVRTDLMEEEPVKFKGIKRNLFGSLYPPPKAKPAPPPPKPTPPPPPPPPKVVEPPPVVEVIRRELAKFTFMGYLRKQEKWTIFLKSSEDIFLVSEGDRFGGKKEFLAKEITPEQLVIEQASQGEIVIPLVEKQPLVPSSIPSSAPESGESSISSGASTTSPRLPASTPQPHRAKSFRRTMPQVQPPSRTPAPVAPNDEVSDER